MLWDLAASHSDAAVIEYLDSLYSYALILSRNQAAAEYLVLKTYAHEIEATEKPGATRNKKSWLFTILRDLWFKRPSRRQDDDLPYDIQEDASSADPCAPKKERVKAAIQRLPMELREIVFLHEYEGLSYSEIATILNCSIETVAPQLKQAREKLRTLLAAELNVPVRSQEKNRDEKESGAGTFLFFNKGTFFNN